MRDDRLCDCVVPVIVLGLHVLMSPGACSAADAERDYLILQTRLMTTLKPSHLCNFTYHPVTGDVTLLAGLQLAAASQC